MPDVTRVARDEDHDVKAGGSEAARWARVGAAFDRVIAAPPEAREESLRVCCGDDVALRGEVESLLDALYCADDFLDGTAASLVSEDFGADAPDEGDQDPPHGARIGPFLIVRRIGQGGMGAVFLAEREDPELRQRVAIKLMRGRGPTSYALQRFVEERQILASLEHPDIARLVDGGVTADGTPWFAMEHVDGVPLDRYCDARDASVADRVALFCRVCDAVQYAHRQLVVHRDLKPSNILVTAEGQPKLLDFGVAKLVGTAEDPAAGGPAAGWGGFVGRAATPGYASPEQLRGEPATTASDVYALGVVLHLLLTGARPGRSDTGATPLRDARPLTGDLAAIVAMATQRDADRRYATADQLATDLRRYLADLPVAAAPRTGWYRGRKFVRRNRTVVTLGTIAALATLAFAIVTARQARSLAAERDRTVAVEGFLAGLLLRADPYEADGQAATVRGLLDSGVEQLASGAPADPELRARLHFAFGKAYYGLAEYDRAIAALDSSHRLQQRLHGAESPAAIAVANQLADVLRMAGRTAQARALYEVVLRARRADYGERSTEVARSMNGLALVAAMQGRYEEAESLLRRALAIDRARAGEEPAALTQSLNNLGRVMRERGDLVAAESLHRESLAARKALWGDSHFEVSVSLANLADVLRDRGSLESADSVYRQGLELRERLVGEMHPDLAMDRERYARLLYLAGRPDSAEHLFRRALAVQRRVLPAGHPSTATTLFELGVLLGETGRRGEARAMLAEALAMRERMLPSEGPRVQEVRRALETVGRN